MHDAQAGALQIPFLHVCCCLKSLQEPLEELQRNSGSHFPRFVSCHTIKLCAGMTLLAQAHVVSPEHPQLLLTTVKLYALLLIIIFTEPEEHTLRTLCL